VGHVAAEAGDLADELGRQEGVPRGRGDEQRVDPGDLSFSKSDTARRPFTMKSAPTSWASWTTRLENIVTRTLSRCATHSLSICSRSPSENSGSPFCGFRIAATTTWSNRRAAVSMISRCPL